MSNLPDTQTENGDRQSVAPQRGGSLLVASDFDEAVRIAKSLAKSNLVPNAYQGKWNDILVAIQMGQELGLQPMQALQNIAVINGNPSLYGSGIPALARSHPLWDETKYEEFFEGEPYQDDFTAVCRVGRKDADEPHEQRFSVADAKKAGLWDKRGPWQKYPKRMLQHRARKYGVEDVFPDALNGLPLADEARNDLPPRGQGIELEAEFEFEDDGPDTESRTESLKDELGGSDGQESGVTDVSAEVVEEDPEPETESEEGGGPHPLPDDFPFVEKLREDGRITTVEAAYSASPSTLESVDGIGPERAEKIHNMASVLRQEFVDEDEDPDAEPELGFDD